MAFGYDRTQDRFFSKRAALAASTGLSFAFILTSTPAYAAAQTDPAPDAVADAAPQNDEAMGTDIIVTAQRRGERLSDVPASITALDSGMLSSAGVIGVKELAVVTPGLVYNVTPPQAQPAVRGVGSSLTTTGNDPAVALYVDGVYMPSQTANVFDLNNIDQVEVLKGPQGTLYGRNATGGAILITTRKPTFDFAAEASIGYGSFDEVRAEGFVNIPVTDKLAVNAAVSYRDDNGYTTNLVTGNRLSTLRNVDKRVRVRWQPTDAIDFVLSGDHTFRSDLTGYSLLVFNNNSSARNRPGYIQPNGYDVALGPIDPITRVYNRGVSLLGTFDVGSGTFTTLTSYRSTKGHFLTDTDRTNFLIQDVEIFSHQNTFQQDMTFASNFDGPFQLTAGGSAYFDTAAIDNYFLRSATTTTLIAQSRVRTDAYSGFFELNYSILDNLHILGGVRYSTETKDFRSNNATLQGGAKTTFSAWTPRFAVRFEPTPEFNVYASYTQGFKSGVYNTFAVSANPVAVLPEDIDAYEIGAKYNASGFSIAASAFTYDYKNVQVTAIGVGGVAQTLNAARERIKGVDLEISAPVTDYFTLKANAAYTHARYKSFPNAQFYTPLPAGGNAASIGVATGNRVPRVPDFTAGLNGQLKVPLASGNFEASANAYYTSSTTWNPNERLVQPKYVLVNANVGWASANDRWRVTFWARNLTDKYYYTYMTDSALGDGATPARPRSVGVTLAMKLD